MSPLANSFQSWRVTHDLHHAHTQLRGQEVDWAANLVTREEFQGLDWRHHLVTWLGYHLPLGIFLWIAWNTFRRGVSFKAMLPSEVGARCRNRLLLSNMVAALCLFAIYGGLWAYAGIWVMLKNYGIPATIGMVTGWTIIAIQHGTEGSILYERAGWTPIRGQLVSTFDIRFPRWLEYLWCNINMHIPHHVAPAVPWYYLKKAAGAMQQHYPQYFQEESFNWRHVSWLWRTPFLKKDEERGYYVLDFNRSWVSSQ